MEDDRGEDRERITILTQQDRQDPSEGSSSPDHHDPGPHDSGSGQSDPEVVSSGDPNSMDHFRDPLIVTEETGQRRPTVRVQRGQCGRALLALVVFVLVVTGSATLLYMRKNWRRSSGTPSRPFVIDTPHPLNAVKMKEAEFHGSFQMRYSWSNQFLKQHSSRFRILTFDLQKLTEEIYSYSPLKDHTIGVNVTRLSKHRHGVLLVTFNLKIKTGTQPVLTKFSPLADSGVGSSDLKEAFVKGYYRLLNSAHVLHAHQRLATKIVLSTFSLTSSDAASSAPSPQIPTPRPRIPATTTMIPTAATSTATKMIPTAATTTTTKMIPAAATTTWKRIPTADTMREPIGPQCGEVRVLPEMRVVGGEEPNKGVYPWMVMVTKNGKFQCGGSILDAWHVLTAAHCLTNVSVTLVTGLVDLRPNNVMVIAGKHKRSLYLHHDQDQRAVAHTAYIHSSYQTSSMKNDIAVIKLSKPLWLNSRVSPICLPEANSRMPKRCVAAGWGTLTEGLRVYPTALRSATLFTYNRTECLRIFKSYDSHDDHPLSYYLNEGIMCAANTTSGGQDTCQGDSGGPLFCLQEDKQIGETASRGGWQKHYTQFGIVSFGEGCGRPGKPGFYTYLPHFLPWLHNVALPQLDAKNLQFTDICHNTTAVSSALQTCTSDADCVSMMEVTLCVHGLLDMSWEHCTRKDLQTILQDRFSASFRLCDDYAVRTKPDGRLFMHMRDDWYVVCGDHWGQPEVNIVCTQQGFKAGKPSYIHRTEENVFVSGHHNASFRSPTAVQASGWMSITCSGNETSLAECDLARQSSCSTSYIAAAFCYNTADQFTLDPQQPNASYGFVRLSRDKGQGHVCVPDLSDRDAHFLCRDAGYVAGMAFRRPMTPPTSGAVWETEMECGADAVDAHSCVTRGWNLLPRAPKSCVLAKVFCFKTKTRFHNGLLNSTGLVQMYQASPHNHHDVTLKTVCRQGFDNVTAAIVCRQNGFERGGYALSFNPFYRPNTDYVKVRCGGLEEKLEDCALENVSGRLCTAGPAVARCFVAALDDEPELSIRVSPENGEVQIFMGNQWGTVCTDHWTHNEAAAICRQLGHPHGYRRFSTSVGDYRGSLPHVLHELNCGVGVTSLQQCSYQRVQSDVCQYVRPAAVGCTQQPYPAFTLESTTSQLNQGQVHVTYNGTTAPLVAFMSNSTASALCRSLGHVTGELRSGRRSARTGDYWWIDFWYANCTSSSEIHQCVEEGPRLINCTSYSYRDWRCGQPMVSVYCYTAAARVHTGARQTTGIVQLYRGGKWWEVCHDDITQAAAEVICRDAIGSPSASALLLRDAYRTGSYTMVKAHAACDSRDSGMTSTECITLDLTSRCPSLNSRPAAVVCYDGEKPSGEITDWKTTSASYLSTNRRVWVKRYGVWGTVCDDTWVRSQAELLCKEEGYTSGTYTTSGLIHLRSVPLWAWSVNCTSADNIQNCTVRLTNDVTGTCSASRDAGVICSRYSSYRPY